jgi:cytochrome b561
LAAAGVSTTAHVALFIALTALVALHMGAALRRHYLERTAFKIGAGRH